MRMNLQLGEMATVHRSKVKARRLVDPTYPPAARALNLHPISCRFRIFIDGNGVPQQRIVFHSCPGMFQESVEHAVMQWRFYPYRDEAGTKRPVQTNMEFIFRPPK